MDETSPLSRLRGLQVGAGQVGITWLGQAGFAVRTTRATIVIDLFLSPYEGRLYPSPLVPEQATGVDLVLCTHEHVDHLDAGAVPTIAAASPGARFVVPTPIVDLVTEAGIREDRVTGAQPGRAIEVAGVTIHPVPARHGVTMEDAYTFGQELSGGLVRYLGFVVDAEGARIYHAGDTIHYDGMVEALRDLRVDVALLPINGRDAQREARGIVGNLDHREAAWLADEIGADLLVPMHYDLFERNRGYPDHLVDVVRRDHPGLTVLVPSVDRPFVYGGRAR